MVDVEEYYIIRSKTHKSKINNNNNSIRPAKFSRARHSLVTNSNLENSFSSIVKDLALKKLCQPNCDIPFRKSKTHNVLEITKKISKYCIPEFDITYENDDINSMCSLVSKNDRPYSTQSKGKQKGVHEKAFENQKKIVNESGIQSNLSIDLLDNGSYVEFI